MHLKKRVLNKLILQATMSRHKKETYLCLAVHISLNTPAADPQPLQGFVFHPVLDRAD